MEARQIDRSFRIALGDRSAVGLGIIIKDFSICAKTSHELGKGWHLPRRRRPLALIVYAKQITVGGSCCSVGHSITGPVTQFGTHLLIDILGLFDPVHRNIVVGQYESFQALRAGDDVFIDEVLDTFFQHDPIFGGLLAVAGHVFFIAIAIGSFPIVFLVAVSCGLFAVTHLLCTVTRLLFAVLSLFAAALFAVAHCLLLVAVRLFAIVDAFFFGLLLIAFCLFAIPAGLFPIPIGLLAVAVGLFAVPFGLLHVPIFIAGFDGSLYSFDQRIVFCPFGGFDLFFIDVDLCQFAVYAYEFVAMGADVGGEDIFSRGREEDVIAIADGIVCLAFGKGDSRGEEECKRDFQAHGACFLLGYKRPIQDTFKKDKGYRKPGI
jgi:hypothetical protein